MRFNIVREDTARLRRQVWTFALHAEGNSESEYPKINLIRYHVETRENTRKRWKRDQNDYLYSSGYTDDWRYGKYIPQNEVPIPYDVRSEAIRFICDKLTVEIPKGHFERQEEERAKRG